MSFTFGATSNQAQPSTSLFGNTAAAAHPKATFGGFQTPNPQQSQSQTSNLFGTPNNATQPTNSLFGNTAQTQPQQQQVGSLFGQANTTGQAAGGGGLFGSSTTINQAGAGGGGLFGSASNQAGTGGGLFGAGNKNTTQQPSTGLFGATATQQPAQTSTGLFGSANANAQQPSGGLFGNSSTTQPAQTTGLFGLANNNTTSGGMFGQNQQTQQGGSSLFGQNNQAQNQNQGTGGLGGSLFGNTNTNTNTSNQASGSGLFGQQQPQPQQTSLFGAPAQNTGPGLFGANQNNQNQNFAASQNQNPNQNLGTNSLSGSTNGLARSAYGYMNATVPEKSIEERMRGINNAWDSNSPECRFKYYFYNVVEPGTAGRYGLPAGAVDDERWKQARRNNPDPHSMVPVLATGWEHVKKRSEMQEQIASVHQQRIKEIKQVLDQLTRQASLNSAIRLQTLQTSLQALQHRLLHLVAQTPNVIPNSSPFHAKENEIRLKLDTIKQQIDGKDGGKRLGGGAGGVGVGREGRLIGQVNELWGVVEELRRRRKIRETGGREGWLGDEKSLTEVAQILATQQQALQKLTEMSKEALIDTEVMRMDLALM